MITFHTIKWVNFLSTGNTPTEISLDSHSTTLIVGQNGAGKSTFLDALSFALFGKAHRNINKGQLVNSVNNKGTLVELDFSVGNQKFKVIRGMKPTKFEIYQNGEMLNQNAQSRDYQKHLEQNILKLNHKSFHQIVVLGSSSFVPFMQLPAAARREVIEDLLDIQVFTKMNSIVKERMSKLKEELKDSDRQVSLITEKVSLQKKYIDDIKVINENQNKQKQEEIENLEREIDEFRKSNLELIESIESIGDAEDLNRKIQKFESKKSTFQKYEAQFSQQVSQLVKEAKFYEDNETCPTCTQKISDDVRNTKLEESRSKATELNDAIQKAKDQSGEIQSTLRKLNEDSMKIRSVNQQVESNLRSMKSLSKRVEELQNRKAEEVVDIEKEMSVYQDLLNQKESLSENKFELHEQKRYIEASIEMLKDTGIKTKIVKEYLPVMNTLINKYLNTLNFFVSFHLDESFSEVIKSRHRDEFNYASFSEGEKQRINLALLFTWRQIAKMKNSASTNLLVMDEVMDSSIDGEGIEELQSILFEMGQGTNIFIISHREELKGNEIFERTLNFKKESNFSEMNEE